ncbi:YihY/virulence factor BrkB family protein [Cellulomonas sp. NPDC089187]|uniref:YihY/virulence factor BrkB family protein n=1 Tax=Cellulomonas sp. NPDC089187 TaxID=3154970 RepID=UPI00343B95AB
MNPAEPRGAGRVHADIAGPADTAAGDRKDVGTRAYPAGLKGLIARGQAALAWWQRTRAARANARFGSAGGGVLTGGIAYAALFSVFAGLTIGYTAFMAVLGGNDDLRATVLDTIDANLPGLVDTGDGGGIIDPNALQFSRGLGIASIIAFVVLLMSAISAMAALRTAVRAMFDQDPSGGDNPVVGKLRELGGFVGLGVAILLSAVLSIVTTTAADWLLGIVGLDDSTAGAIAVRVLGILVAFVVDAATFCLIVLLLSGLRPAWKDLRGGAIIAGIGLGVVRVLGTSVVAGSASKNALLASFAVIITLLVWMNLISRIVLLAAAWTADPPAPDDPA